MQTAFASIEIPETFLERYPELFFRLSYTEYTPVSSPRQLSIHLEDLKEIDVVYIYGLFSDPSLAEFLEWLEIAKEKRLVFLEKELGAIAAFLQAEEAEKIFSHPQIEIHFLSEEAELEELVLSHSTERVEVYSALPKTQDFEEIRLKILRLSSVFHALMAEALFSHKLLPNLLANIQRWPGSFLATGLKGKFKNIPAIICGAGPSLEKSFSLLKKLEDKALILAGGSTIASLSNHGIIPHIGIALDPNREEFDRLKAASSYEMPLIYGSRLQAEVLLTANGERGYLHSDTGGPFERHFEQAMGLQEEAIGPELGSEALSVTTLAIALAVEMGCNPILLDGVDLAYTGMRRYAAGVMPSSSVNLNELQKHKKASERLLERKNIYGENALTLVKWVMESECIAAYAKNHPEHRFYNVSQGGLGFEGIPNRSLNEVVEEEFHQTLDLHSLVHATIESLKIPLSKESIETEMKEIQESLDRLFQITEEMIVELETGKLYSGKTTILEIDFEEEKAFECLFSHVMPALDRLLERKFPSSALQKNLAKWKQLKEMIAYEQRLLALLYKR